MAMQDENREPLFDIEWCPVHAKECLFFLETMMTAFSTTISLFAETLIRPINLEPRHKAENLRSVF